MIVHNDDYADECKDASSAVMLKLARPADGITSNDLVFCAFVRAPLSLGSVEVWCCWMRGVHIILFFDIPFFYSYPTLSIIIYDYYLCIICSSA